ncbi:hypothetical protein CDL15_Pgr021280 [Punica granatum]|uniref:RRM domain-containing protein n=1 Tax=Punica granatum TaxID=22663 RepID=A0A218WR01_PUNGR|nr:hypothetical protein CDL15_Pgr021280 [Punica granatum]PKI75126.1 hypothetical protein CRG98_004461 [Punica granatum]
MDPQERQSFADGEAEDFKPSSDHAHGYRSQPHAGYGASPGKIFIGGLARETTTAQFVKHFGSYGEIIDSVIMKDRKTGHPRGFGFVTYADPSVVDKVIEDTHIINGKQVEIKRTIPKGAGGSEDFKTKKIFVGGIPGTVTEDEFKDFFSQFGEVKDHQIMKDHSTNRSRGFGFITFETEEAVDELLAQGNRLELAGSQVEVKKAEPKRPNAPPPSSRRFSSSRSSYGGDVSDSYGGYGGYRSGGGAYGGRASAYGGYGGGAEFGGGYGGYGGGGMGGPYRGDQSMGYSSRYGGGLNRGYNFGGSYGGGGDGYGGYGGSSGGGYGAGGYGGSADGGYGSGSGGSYGSGAGGAYGGSYDSGFEGGGEYGGGGGNSYYGGRGSGYGGGSSGGGGSGFGGSAGGRYHPYGR